MYHSNPLLERSARVEIDWGMGRVWAREKKGGKKSKVGRALQKKINKEAQKKCKEAEQLVKKAKASNQRWVSLFLVRSDDRIIPELTAKVAERIVRLLKKRKGWKVQRNTQQIPYVDDEDTDHEPKSRGPRYNTFIFITGFAKF